MYSVYCRQLPVTDSVIIKNSGKVGNSILSFCGACEGVKCDSQMNLGDLESWVLVLGVLERLQEEFEVRAIRAPSWE